ncbi:hypothetical protein [Celeribacter sp.]|uniref:hypothetical protein n=1 Tax=Celeribacter sp. TaxID=1890673 RepID=UPI003A90B6AE
MTNPEHDDHIPADLTPENENEVLDERARMFTLGFWKSLLAGHEGLGDTFWAGNYLAALLFLPLMVLLFTIASFLPSLSFLLSTSFVALGVYFLFVARAVWLAKPKGDTGLGWKIVGVIWTLMNAGMSLAYAPFTGGA